MKAMAILVLLLLLLSLFALRLSSLLSFTVTTIIIITFTISIIITFISFIMKINIPFYHSCCKLVSVILHRSREYSRFLRDFAHDDGC